MGKEVILISILFLLTPFIIAEDSKINIQTFPYHRLLVSVYKSDVTPPERITSFPPYRNTQASGELSFSLSTSEKKVDIKLDLRKEDGTSVKVYSFEDIETGKPIFISFFPPDRINLSFDGFNSSSENSNISNAVVNEVNQTIQNNVSLNNSESFEELNKNEIISESTNIKDYSYIFRFLFYLVITLIVIGGIFFIVFFVKKSFKKNYVPPVDFRSRKAFYNSSKIFEIERKLKKIQQEVETIKSRDRDIREAEKRLEEDRMKLERLKRGY